MPGSKKNKLPNSLLTASPHPKWCEGGDGLGEGTTTAEDWEKWWLMAHVSIPKAKWHWSAWHRRGNAKPWPRSPCLGPVFCITVRCLWAAAGMLSVRWFCSLHYWNRSGQKQDKNNRLPIILSLRISYPEGNSPAIALPPAGRRSLPKLCTRRGRTPGGAGNPTMNRRAGQRARSVKGMVAAPLEKSWGKG